MTLARELTLTKTEGQYFLSQNPIAWCDANSDTVWKKETVLQPGDCFEAAGLCIVNAGNRLCVDGRRIARMSGESTVVQICYDNGYLELFADEGRIVYSKNIE